MFFHNTTTPAALALASVLWATPALSEDVTIFDMETYCGDEQSLSVCAEREMTRTYNGLTQGHRRKGMDHLQANPDVADRSADIIPMLIETDQQTLAEVVETGVLQTETGAQPVETVDDGIAWADAFYYQLVVNARFEKTERMLTDLIYTINQCDAGSYQGEICATIAAVETSADHLQVRLDYLQQVKQERNQEFRDLVTQYSDVPEQRLSAL